MLNEKAVEYARKIFFKYDYIKLYYGGYSNTVNDPTLISDVKIVIKSILDEDIKSRYAAYKVLFFNPALICSNVSVWTDRLYYIRGYKNIIAQGVGSVINGMNKKEGYKIICILKGSSSYEPWDISIEALRNVSVGVKQQNKSLNAVENDIMKYWVSVDSVADRSKVKIKKPKKDEVGVFDFVDFK